MKTRNKLRRVIALLLSVGLLFGINFSTSAQQVSKEIEVHYAPFQFLFHNERMTPPKGQEGFIYQGATYVPLRFVAYSLDKTVLWDQNTYTVTLQEPDRQERVLMRDYKLNWTVRNPVFPTNLIASAATIPVYFEQVQYWFDGKQQWPDEETPGLIFNNTLYVPLRFVSETLGLEVTWDQATYTVTIGTPKSKEENGKPADRTDHPQYPGNSENPGNHSGSDGGQGTKQKPDSTPGSSPGNGGGQKPAPTPGQNPDPKPGQNPGQNPQNPGQAPGGNPGQNHGENPGKTPGKPPGKPPGKTPGSGSNPPSSPPPTHNPGNGSGGDGNNGTPEQSYESIIGNAESEISSLQSKAESELSAIVDEFKQTKDISLMAQGQSLLSSFDQEFDNIMNNLTNELSENGYDTEIVERYREQYEQVKSEKEQEVINDLLS